jgi:magnesium transporter
MMVIRRTTERRPERGAEESPSPRMEDIRHGRLRWLDIQSPTPAEMQYLQKDYPFHPLDLDDCLSNVQRPKLDTYEEEEYLFLVLHFPLFDPFQRLAKPAEVDIFIGRDYVITVHDGRLKVLNQLRASCEADEAVRNRLMGRGSGLLLYHIIDQLVNYCFPILDKVGQHIDRVEHEIFERNTRVLVQELSYVRRDIISLRRIVKPNIPVLRQFEARSFPFLQLDEEVYFGDILDHANRQWDMLEDDKDIIEGLNGTLDSLMSHRINEVMKILTLISVVLLPMTLVASVYGMNVSTLPLAQHPFSFVLVMGLMALCAVVMLAYFKFRGWI